MQDKIVSYFGNLVVGMVFEKGIDGIADDAKKFRDYKKLQSAFNKFCLDPRWKDLVENQGFSSGWDLFAVNEELKRTIVKESYVNFQNPDFGSRERTKSKHMKEIYKVANIKKSTQKHELESFLDAVYVMILNFWWETLGNESKLAAGIAMEIIAMEIKKLKDEQTEVFLKLRKEMIKDKEKRMPSIFSLDTIKDTMRRESKRSKKRMRTSRDRFYHLTISEIILPRMSEQFIETSIRVNENENISLDSCLENLWSNECKHALIVGEGGMGKTVSLITLWEQYLNCGENKPVPIYIPLDEYNNTEEHEKNHFIMNYIGRAYLGRKNLTSDDENNIWELLRNPDISNRIEIPSVILLLDGFNEVTVERTGLLIELNSMIEELQGVQILITSRLDIRGIYSWGFFNQLDLLPLNDKQINNYLTTQNNTCMPRGNLLELVRNPMMLTIYAKTCHVIEDNKDNEIYDFKAKTQSAGEMLWNFIESQLVKVTENYNEGFYHSFLLKHLLPYIGWEMESRGKFSFSLNELMKSINNACEKLNSSDFFQTFPEYMEHEDELCLGKLSGTEGRKRFVKMKNSMVNELVMLVKEKKEYRFLHQNFRDYFAAVHILNEMELFLNAGGDLPNAIKDQPISYYVRRLIGEIEGEQYNIPLKDNIKEIWSSEYYTTTRLSKILDKCRGIFDGSLGHSIWNIIEIWKDVRGELTGCDLSNLDLEKISLNGISCSQLFGEKYLTTKFNDSRLLEQNFLPQGHSAPVYSASYSSDGSRIVSASWNIIKVWDARTFECLKTLEGHSGDVTSASYSPDGSRIVSASRDKTIKVWDARTFECLKTLEEHSGDVISASYSLDGSRIVSASWDHTIKVWDTRTFECLQTLEGDSYGGVISASYSPNGSCIVSTSYDKTIKVWDAQTFECLQKFGGDSFGVISVSYSPDGSHIVSASRDKTIKVWDAQTFECLQRLEGHTASVISVLYSPDGSRIVSASWDKTIKVWDARTFECLKTLAGHSDDVTRASYSPDGRRIVSASRDKTIKVWDERTFECLKTIEGYSEVVTSASYSPDGSRIVSASWDKTIKVWGARTFECIKTLEGHSDDVTRASYSPDGSRIVSASGDKTIKVWDARTFECLKTLVGHSDDVTSASYSPDGSHIVSASSDKTIKVWDARTFDFLKTLAGHTEGVTSASYSPNGSRIVSASWDKTIKIWDTQTFECLKTLNGHLYAVISASYCLDNSRIVSTSYDKTIKVWDARTFDCLKTLAGHSEVVTSASYAPDGSRIVSASGDKTIKVWDARTFECLKTLERHSEGVTSASYSPDGSRIVSSSYDNTIKVWDARTFDYLKNMRNVKGLFIQGCDFSNTKLNEKLNKYLALYGGKNIL